MYEITILPGVTRYLKTIPVQERNRILDHIISLRINPRPPDVKKVKGEENQWRIRVGDYRVLYEIHDRQ